MKKLPRFSLVFISAGLFTAGGCPTDEASMTDKIADATCAKLAECVEGFDEQACNDEEPADTSGCVYDAAAAKECFKGIEDAPCGTEEEGFFPELPSACSEVYTDCEDDYYDDEEEDEGAIVGIEPGTSGTGAGPEGITIVKNAGAAVFGAVQNAVEIIVAHSEGFTVHRADGSTRLERSSADIYEAKPVVSPDGTQYAAVAGANGFELHYFSDEDEDFTSTQLTPPFNNTTDVCALEGRLDQFYYVDNAGGTVNLRVYNNNGTDDYELSFGAATSQAQLPVSACGRTDRSFVAISDGTPGKAWYFSTFNANGVELGNLGNSPRRIRCTYVGNNNDQLCAATSYGSNQLDIIDWPALGTPSISDTVDLSGAPVGVDIVADGNRAIAVVTGFDNNTVSWVEINADGEETDTISESLSGCQGPGHASWIDADHVAVTCNTNDKLQIIEVP